MEVSLANIKKKANIILAPKDIEAFNKWYDENFYDILENGEDYLAEGVVSFWEVNFLKFPINLPLLKLPIFNSLGKYFLFN